MTNLTQKIKQRNERLMHKIIRYLHSRDLFYDVTLYANGRKYASEQTKDSSPLSTYGIPYYDLGEADVKQTDEYANPDTVTLIFEGPLYDAMNLYYPNTVEQDLQAIAAKYGMYFEQGHAWSTSCWPA